MRYARELRAIGAAALAGVAALGGAAALAGAVRAREARLSHQQPPSEPWWKPEMAPPAGQVARGRTLFLNSCAHCHGIDARGDEGPDLHELQVSDRYIANTIRRGIRGEMPSFAKKHNAADVAALVAYVRSLTPE